MSDNWKSDLLGNVATLQRGFDLPHRLRRPGKVPIVTSSGIEDTHNEAKVKAPGVVTGRYGTIGEVYFVDEDFWPHNTTLYVRDFHGNNPLFISYLLRTIDFHMHSGKTGVPGVNRNDLHEITVSIPLSITEQKAIAKALSDADAFIEALEQLVAKKRKVKQGVMQELFTGKRRLPGFSEKREDKQLGELSEMGSGGTPLTSNPNYYDGNIPWVSIADMTQGGKFISTTERNLTTAGLNNSAAQMFPTGTVLYAMYASLGECSIANVSLCTSQAILGIRVKSGLHNEFLYYFLNYIKPQVKTMGQHGTQANLNKGMVQDFQLKLPPLPEQTAIAEILSDMDAEIAALEGKLSKARDVKQGMMSVLLTGKIRLVES